MILERFRYLPHVLYIAGLVPNLFFLHSFLDSVYHPSADTQEAYNLMIPFALYTTSASFLIALMVAIYQYFTIKNTLARNQLILLITGSFFVFLPLGSFIVFYDWFIMMIWYHSLELFSALGNLILVVFILIAIFRYRIWDMEVIIRKALLYLGATSLIIANYLFLIWLVNQVFTGETNLIRFAILAVSVILFLVLRDRLQRLIDRLFHREEYDSASMVSDFEAKLAGIYRFDEMKQKIVQSIDGIFHFKSFVFNLRKSGLTYEPVFVYGSAQPEAGKEYEISRELEERLQKAKVFSPEELSKKIPILEETTGELIVPLISDGRPSGFFICGQKRSERIYSRQDIQVLRLLAQRVVSLLHTAGLYQKEVDRQLMLERERVRISQDLHDDVGASLTRISMMSDLVKNRTDVGGGAREWLGKISDTSRGLMEEMNQIIWALNPKNDNLESLVAYIRRFAIEYLEPTSVQGVFNLPGERTGQHAKAHARDRGRAEDQIKGG